MPRYSIEAFTALCVAGAMVVPAKGADRYRFAYAFGPTCG
jgi:hypothetical protein